ncbi:hypothetical protein IR145_17800, partial [Streptococcus danieliae]|nr:hypothetical protein [Streptococcus danieliae]
EKIEDTDAFLSNIKRVNSNLQNIKEKRILTEEEYRLINNDKSIDLITSFINSEVIDLVKNSKKIDTELAFNSMKKASEIYSGVSKE